MPVEEVKKSLSGENTWTLSGVAFDELQMRGDTRVFVTALYILPISLIKFALLFSHALALSTNGS